jgi:hypothetical protein
MFYSKKKNSNFKMCFITLKYMMEHAWDPSILAFGRAEAEGS